MLKIIVVLTFTAGVTFVVRGIYQILKGVYVKCSRR